MSILQGKTVSSGEAGAMPWRYHKPAMVAAASLSEEFSHLCLAEKASGRQETITYKLNAFLIYKNKQFNLHKNNIIQDYSLSIMKNSDDGFHDNIL